MFASWTIRFITIANVCFMTDREFSNSNSDLINLDRSIREAGGDAPPASGARGRYQRRTADALAQEVDEGRGKLR